MSSNLFTKECLNISLLGVMDHTSDASSLAMLVRHTLETVVYSARKKKNLLGRPDGSIDLQPIFLQPKTEKCCFYLSPSILGLGHRRQRAEKMVTYLEGNLNLGKCRIF